MGMFDWLRRKRKEPSEALLIAIDSGDTDKVRRLLEEGADVNARDKYFGKTALIKGIRNAGSNCTNIVKLLLEKGADPNLKCKLYGEMALIEAAYKNEPEIVRILLDKGADVNVRDDRDCTPLRWAVGYGYIDIVNLLLEKGADVNEKDKDGSTSLITAAYNGKTKVVRILLDKGADINAKNKDGMTALMYAAQEGHSDILKLLKEAGMKDVPEADAKEDLDQLVEALKSNKSSVQLDASDRINDIAKSGDERLLPLLVGVLRKGNELARELSASAIGTLGDKKATQPLIEALNDPSWSVCHTAVEALGNINDPASIEPIKKCVIETDHERVRGKGIIVLDDCFNVNKDILREVFLKSKASPEAKQKLS